MNQMRFKNIIFLLFAALAGFAQGVINNGAQLVLTSGANVYIDGVGSGNFLNQSGGLVVNNTPGGVITLLGNWTNNTSNSAFGNDGATVVLSGANQIIGGSNPTAFDNLTLSGSGTKQLAVNQVTVGGQATYTGILALGGRPLDLNGNRLEVTNSSVGAITYGSGYIISETNSSINPSVVRWYHRTGTGSRVYPFGLSGSQIPFTFNITSPMGGTSDYVDVSTRATANSSNTPWAGISNVGAVTHMFSPIIGADGSQQVVIDRWWDITASNSVTADVTFSYLGSENTLFSPYNVGNLGAQHWDGVSWNPPVGSAPAVLSGVGAVTATGLSTFSPWVLSSLMAPLPVELIDAALICSNEGVTVSWATASEKNTDHFTIWKSNDGKTFVPLTTVTAAGTSYATHKYTYTDYNVQPGETVYYKLTETDQNAFSKELKTLSTEVCGPAKNEIKVSNSEEGKVTVSFYLQNEEKYVLSVYDVLGRCLRTQETMANKGFDTVTLDTEGLSESYYILHLQSTEETKTQKVYIRN